MTLYLALLITSLNAAEPSSRWTMDKDGGITWTVCSGDRSHQDHVEMSGRKISVIIRYGVGEGGELVLNKTLIWPMLRTIPNDTFASLRHDFGQEVFPTIIIDGQPIGSEKPYEFSHCGMLTIKSKTASGLDLTRVISPSTTKPVVIENCTLANTSDTARMVEINAFDQLFHTEPAKGVYGVYILNACVVGDKTVKLEPGKSVSFSLIFSGRKASEPAINIDPNCELIARRDYVESLWDKLVFECPDPVISREFAFSKLRVAESIFETKAGFLHSPGGGPYYAGIWANDEAEYANPFFPFLGDPTGNEAGLNAYRLFAHYMKPDYKPVPSSIISEGVDTWQGAGDRGDAAMIAYGASRFALASGDKKIAEEMWPIVKWCLEYCRRKINNQGVVASDHDELEGRFPAGDANLCTSALTYDALLSAAWLGESLGKPAEVNREYRKRAEALRMAIEKHFGATVDGYPTYRYYEGNTTLRAWICIPLAMGIYDRSEGTIEALFSPRLWTDDGLATEAGKETFWDRSTLYGLRGAFAAGETERALSFLQHYSKRRLLGEHVPYPVEAWPEGDQRHLSAEGALYCRVITEGMFRIRPTGLRSFECTPRLPKEWDRMALREIYVFGSIFDIAVSRKDGKLVVDLSMGGKQIKHESIKPGDTVIVRLPD